MPAFKIDSLELDLPAMPVLLDTNILLSRFCEEDQYHDEADQLLELLTEYYSVPVVPLAVLIEAWGLLVGSRKQYEGGLSLLEWATSPGSAILLPDYDGVCASSRRLASERRIDLVDAILVCLATEIRTQAAGHRTATIATYDTRDFFRLLGDRSVQFTLFDARTCETLEGGAHR